MPEIIEMTADDTDVPSFGGGATRVLSENELDGLIEATVSAADVNHPRAPKETKRIEALAKIQPGTETRGEADAAATEAALLDAAYSGSSIVVEADLMQPAAPTPSLPPAPTRSRRVLWFVALLAVAIAGAMAARAFLPH